MITETEQWQYLHLPSSFTRAWDQHRATVDPEGELSRHGTRINSKVKNVINCDLICITITMITTTQRLISNYLRKTCPHKVTITASHLRNRPGCELPQRCYSPEPHTTNQPPLMRKGDFLKRSVHKP